jgi:hypothetical protein
MSVLSIVTTHCQVHGLNVPSSVVNSSNAGVNQILGLITELVDEIMDQDNYQAATVEKTFALTATEDQGALTTLLGADYKYLHPETLFDRTLRRPLYGPLTDKEWQEIKALVNPGPFYKFRLRGDHLLINPTPAAPLSTVACEYASTYGVKSSGGTLKAAITLDTDTFVLPEMLIRAGLKYKWKRTKSLPYAEDETDYYGMLNNYIARDKAPRTYRLDCNDSNILKPGVFVPAGNWLQ